MRIFRYGPFEAELAGPMEPLVAASRDSRFLVEVDDHPSTSRVLILEACEDLPAGQMTGTPNGSRNGHHSIVLEAPAWKAEVTLESARAQLPSRMIQSSEALDGLLSAIGVAWVVLSGGLLVHASSIATPDGGFLFVGRSGVGKTTLVWKLFHGAWEGVSDDQTLLVFGQGRWTMASTNVGWKRRETLSRIYFLEQSGRTSLRELSGGEALRRLMRNIVLWPAEPCIHDEVLETAARVVSAAVCHDLSVCLQDFSKELLTG